MSSLKDREILYDIKPVDQSGRVDLAKISQGEPKIDLRSRRAVRLAVSQAESPADFHPVRSRPSGSEGQTPYLKMTGLFPSKSMDRTLTTSYGIHQEVRKEYDITEVIARVGGVMHPISRTPPPRRGLISRASLAAADPALPSPNVILPVTHFYSREAVVKTPPLRVVPPRPPNFSSEKLERASPLPVLSPASVSFVPIQPPPSKPVISVSPSPEVNPKPLAKERHWGRWIVIGGAAFFLVVGLVQYGQKVKEGLLKDGTKATNNLKEAKTDLENFDFESAANKFTLAYDNFSRASTHLNSLGSSLSFLAELPGFKKLKAANNVVKAGQQISRAGEDLSLALDNLYRTNFISHLGFSFLTDSSSDLSLNHFVNLFRDALIYSQKRISTASQLLAEVDEASLPAEKKAEFLDLKKQLPLVEDLLGKGVDYGDFLLEVLGQGEAKKYLILFQNNTELRATGGFPGSYALIGFNHGLLREFAVDDTYNIDGQAKTSIIPPKELQHITQTWGMRDASWFVNFPNSARKVMQMYTENDGGPAVDGVLTITPSVISRILEVTGPVELPEYKMTLDHHNFLAEIQEEVEYGENRVQPKKVLVDFTPRFIEKLSQQDKEQWFKIVKILLEAVEQKHILAYFKDPDLQKVASDNGLTGEIKKTDQDYLMVNHTNVKGAKTDAVIDNSYKLHSAVATDGTVGHTLTITRTHTGGQSSYGFYNRTSYDYLRILVPKGSVLTSVEGQAQANFSPLVDYSRRSDFAADEDLKDYENGFKPILKGVKEGEEGEKTVWGLWLFLKPGETRSVTLTYQTPVQASGEYLLTIQKQPGTSQDKLDFSFAVPEGKTLIFQHPELTLSGQNAGLKTKLEKDLVFGMKWQ